VGNKIGLSKDVRGFLKGSWPQVDLI
jgi:hypothetical protein